MPELTFRKQAIENNGAVKSTGLRSVFFVSSDGRLSAILDSYCVKAVKGVKFTYESTPRALELLSTFRATVNDAICPDLALREHQGTIEAQGQDMRGVATEIWRRLVLPVFRSRGGLVYRQEAQAMAQETIRKEVDAQDGRASFSLNYSILSLPFKRGEENASSSHCDMVTIRGHS
jgi:hypothetical protein